MVGVGVTVGVGVAITSCHASSGLLLIIISLGTAVDVAVDFDPLGGLEESVGRRRTTHKTKTTNATTSMPTTRIAITARFMGGDYIEREGK